ncbi:hypothetical protein VO64_4878 [Pseudomonas synxantha]|uniref:Threonine synthase n=1 Tax=Pseudomonas synxantha TaxID=47883 RepID=A0AAU8TUL7_9PSED|nr:hypothetical protein VO64_4878 [Pseudomonas synxantha]
MRLTAHHVCATRNKGLYLRPTIGKISIMPNELCAGGRAPTRFPSLVDRLRTARPV